MRVTGLFVAVLVTTVASIGVEINWQDVKITTNTAATIEVDVMPFLGRTDYGGPFNAYYQVRLRSMSSKRTRTYPPRHIQYHGCYQALSDLGAEFVRYAPWFPNPRVVVPELTPSDCTEVSTHHTHTSQFT